EVDAWWRARDVARALKAAVRTATGLSCSIAVAPNKLLAKIASELDKPDGLTVLRPDDIATRIWPLPPRRINGIGPKASAKLEGLGIQTIGELAHADVAWLIEQFGRNYGAWLHEAAHGRDARDVVTESEPKSISRETTFERDLSARRDRDQLSQIFTDLCVSLAGDLQRKGYAGKTIGVKLRYDNFETVTRDHTIERATQDAKEIRRAAGSCLKRVPLARRNRTRRRLRFSIDDLTVARDFIAQPLPEQRDLRRFGEPRRIDEEVLARTRHIDVEQAHEQAVAHVVRQQRRARERDSLARDGRLHQVRRVVEDRPAIGLGPRQSRGREPRLPEFVLRAQQRMAREVFWAPGQAAVRELR